MPHLPQIDALIHTQVSERRHRIISSLPQWKLGGAGAGPGAVRRRRRQVAELGVASPGREEPEPLPGLSRATSPLGASESVCHHALLPHERSDPSVCSQNAAFLFTLLALYRTFDVPAISTIHLILSQNKRVLLRTPIYYCFPNTKPNQFTGYLLSSVYWLHNITPGTGKKSSLPFLLGFWFRWSRLNWTPVLNKNWTKLNISPADWP